MRNKGFSLIELLVYMLLSGILLSVISTAFHSLAKPFKITNKKFSEEEKLNGLVDKLLTSIYKNTLNKFLPIHYWHSSSSLPEYITTRINRLPTNSRPNINSVILELLDTESSLFLRSSIDAYRFQGNINKSVLISNNIKGWVSPEPLGSYLVIAKPKSIFLSGNITEIEFSKEDISLATNVLADTTSSLESIPANFVPIRDHYILYTTNNNTLRRVSLLSSENQPILEGVILEGQPPNSCFIRLESSSKNKQISCENNQSSILMRLHAIDH